MPERNLEKRFGTIAVAKGYITEEQLDDAINIQRKDTIQQRKHRVIGTILFNQGYMTYQQIDEVLSTMEKSLLRKFVKNAAPSLEEGRNELGQVLK